MKRYHMLGLLAFVILALLVTISPSLRAQRAWTAPPNIKQVGVSVPDDDYLRWPLPAGEQAYGAIDGKKIHQYVVEQANISKRYRDQGHPKFWGRIIGASSDQESAEWLAGKFKSFNMTDVKLQPFDLAPQ